MATPQTSAAGRMRATATITTLRTTCEPATLPEALLYEDPSGRVVSALAEENQGQPHRNKTGEYSTAKGAGKARAEHIISERYQWVAFEHPELGIAFLSDGEHATDIHMGTLLARTWQGLIPAHLSSVRVQVTRG
jgi:hypothetical protein